MTARLLVVAIALSLVASFASAQTRSDFRTPPSHTKLVLTGIVTDSASRLVAGARVTLNEISLLAVTDDSGRFTIPDVVPGRYTADVRTTSLDSVDAIHRSSVVVGDSAGIIQLRIPTGEQVARMLCRARASIGGIILGSVHVRGESAPPRTRVVAEWIESSASDSVAHDKRPDWREAPTDSQGRFRMCGVPLNTPVLLRVVGADSGESVEVQIPPGRRLVRTDIIVDTLENRGGVFTGIVLIDSTQEPIVHAQITSPSLMKSVLTNEAGRFRVTDIPDGDHQFMVRRMGYGPLDTTLTFDANATVMRRIFLSKVATLDTVEVTASAVLPSFEEHRALGLGKFITRAELENAEARRLSDVLAQVSGLQVTRGRTGAWVSTSRGPRSLSNVPLLDTADVLRGAVSGRCYARVVLDGAVVYHGRYQEPLFDINTMLPQQIEGIEYYASPSQTPLEYSTLNSHCGVLVIWTRRTP
jgi:hypothetical protein